MECQGLVLPLLRLFSVNCQFLNTFTSRHFTKTYFSLSGPPGCGIWWVWLQEPEIRPGVLLVPQKPHGMTLIWPDFAFPQVHQITDWGFSSCVSCCRCHVFPPPAVAWAHHPLWQRSDFPGFLSQQPQSAGCGDVWWQHSYLQCAESRQQVTCNQQPVSTVQAGLPSLGKMNVMPLMLLSFFAQWMYQQTPGACVAAQVDSARTELDRRGKGGSSLLCGCRWQDQQMVCLQQWPWLHRYYM